MIEKLEHMVIFGVVYISFYLDIALPPGLKRRVERGNVYSMPPLVGPTFLITINEILPLIQKYKIVHLNKTDARLANNGLPSDI
ncbi:hypothetical protein IFM89_003707 [Coptis chinensis]|uniref:Uncharacterized protein n=1 Tax=Coptis chinensis TaxID=261450 RepID=A0A835IRB4_9MAGN|nr:hypothetical protein IFM89_003707 [Coptis chinensis]